MKLPRLFSIMLIALTAIIAAAPVVLAHNQAKYIGIPFVLPGFCGIASAKFVNKNGSLAIQVTQNGGDDNVGFQIFNSVPSSNLGLPSTTTGAIPAGTYSFVMNGAAPGAVFLEVFAVSTTSGGTFSFPLLGVVNNGTITFVVPSGTASVAGYFYPNVSSSLTTTLFLSNFRQNNQSILSDTTQSATSTSNDFYGYCTF